MKKKENKDVIYCVFCGEENNIKDENCSKCKESLDPKSKVYENYLLSNAKDNVKTTVGTNILTVIRNYIQSHLFGAVVLGSIVFTITSAAINTNKEINYETIKEVPVHYEVNKISTPRKTGYSKLGDYINTLLEKKEDISEYKLSVRKPEVYKKLKAKYDDTFNTIQTVDDLEYLTNKSHSYQAYFIFILKDSNYDVEEKGTIDGYDFYRGIVQLQYCGYNDCQNLVSTTRLNYIVEMVKVDGEWYVSGSKKYFEGIIDEVLYGYIERRNFDLSNDDMRGKQVVEYICSGDEECLRKKYGD